MRNEVDHARRVNERGNSTWEAVIYLLFGFMVLCREGSSFLAMSSGKDSLAVFEDKWGPAPEGLNQFISWAGFVAVAYSYACSGIKVLRNNLGSQRAQSTSSEISIPVNVPLFLWGMILLGVIGNGWATAFGTYGSTLRNLVETSNSNSTMPISANTTELNLYNSIPAPSPGSVASDWQFILAIVMATGSGCYSMLYNALQIRKWKQGKFQKLEKGCNKPTLYFGALSILSLITCVISTYYAADIAEKQAGFELPNITSQVLVNGVLQSGLVIVNNIYAQLPSMEDDLVIRFQSNQKVSPLNSFTYGLNARSILYGMSDVLVYGANVFQSFGNIGQTYEISQQMGCSKDTAFWIAITLGSLTSVVNFEVYKAFRTKNAQKGARELIDLGLQSLSRRNQYGEASSAYSFETTTLSVGTPSKPMSRRVGDNLFSPAAKAPNIKAGHEAAKPDEETGSYPASALGMPAVYMTARQRSGPYIRADSGAGAATTRTARGVNFELPSTGRPRLGSTGSRALGDSAIYYEALRSSSASSIEGSKSHFYALNQVMGPE
jgi:hypothetical protein